ncbi:uL15 family ribosomal protein [Candidatus Woesearchaeota archaeon]|nr:uL15 family ribosomal protein [Candidatus Woesearchaeota archaeon]
MMHKRKKATHKRGTETHGHGSSKKRRGAGHRGGRGNSGSGKRGDAKIMKVTKGNKRYLGKYGFKSKNFRAITSINIEQIQQKLDKLILMKLIKNENNVYIVNLKEIGYDKLLSKGKVKNKFKFTVESASQSVIEKVKQAGGEVVLLSKIKKGE